MARQARPRRLVSRATARLRPGRHSRLLTAPAAKAVARQALGMSKPLLPLPPTDAPVHMRTRGIAFILALLGAPFGFYHFYLGYHKRGTLVLLLFGVGGVLTFVGLVTSLFSTTVSAYLVIGLVLVYGLYIWHAVDAIRILLNKLKPKNGEYYPRFFQTRPSASAPR